VTCVVKTIAATMAREADLAQSGGSGGAAGLSAAAQQANAMAARNALYDWLNDPAGNLAMATKEVRAPVPPNVTVVLVLARFPETDEVPAWCWHSEVEEARITIPETASGQYFTLPGDNPVAHSVPTFLWPAASFVIWVENVPDSSQSRVRLVNTTADCDAAAYTDALPVIQDASTSAEQTVKAYLHADMTKRLVCFFELPNSMALVIETDKGPLLEFAQPMMPSSKLVVQGVENDHVHRGLTVNFLLSNAEPGEEAQVYIITKTLFDGNGGECLPASGVDGARGNPTAAAAAEPIDAYVERVATVGLKQVMLLPRPLEAFTHFVFMYPSDTEGFEIGDEYIACYVGQSGDSTRVFNKVGHNLLVRDVITGIHKDVAWEESSGEQTSSKRSRLLVAASLTGQISCFASSINFDRAPLKSEIRGDYAITEPEDFAPAFEETDILGRVIDVPATFPNSNTTIQIDHNPDNIKNIARKPLGVSPTVFLWCYHSESSIVFPNAKQGRVIGLAVLPPPDLAYNVANAAEATTELTLARNVSFPPFTPRWSVGGFPLYYFDEVRFSISPPLPAGISMVTRGDASELGKIKVEASLPTQLAVKSDYVIRAQSKYDIQKMRETTLALSVHEPGSCALLSWKSTEEVVACTVKDTHNFHSEAIYLLISSPGTVEVGQQDAFYCHPGAQPPAAQQASPQNLQFTCEERSTDAGLQCCCWVWLPWGSETENREPGVSRGITARISNAACGLTSRYEVMTMAAGLNPMEGNRVAVVWSRIFEFTVPARDPDASPIQFDLTLGFEYDDVCNPATQGPEAEVQCKEDVAKELITLLGAGEGRISVETVRPAPP